MFTVRPPCKGCGKVLCRLVGFSRRVAGAASFGFVLISIIFFITSTLVLAACSAKGSGSVNVANGASGDAKFECGAETGGDDVVSAMLESAQKMMQAGVTGENEKAIEPVGRVEIEDSGKTNGDCDAAKELGCNLTLLTPDGAIAADAIETVITANGDGSVELVLNANDAAAFSSVNVEIRFDTAEFNPVKWAVGAMFDAGARLPGSIGADRGGDGSAYGIGEKGLLELGSPGSTTGGSMYLGAALRGASHLGVAVARVRPDLNGELSGSGELARIVFERKSYVNPAMDSRNTSADEYVPARTPEYFWDWDYGVVIPRGNSDNLTCAAIFSTQLPGDADGDLEVTVADITPIGVSYLKTMEWYEGKLPVDPASTSSYAELYAGDFLPDLDRNGEVGIPDITEIVHNYSKKYDRMHLYYRTQNGVWQQSSCFDEDLLEQNPADRTGSKSRGFTSLNYGHAPFSADDYEYGLSYTLPGDSDTHILPFAVWDTDLLKKDDLIHDVYFFADSNRIVIENELVGDWDNNCIVDVGDITPLATYFLQKDIVFFGDTVQDDFNEFMSLGNDDKYYTTMYIYCHIAMVAFYYKSTYKGVLLTYYDSVDSKTPIFTYFRCFNNSSVDDPRKLYQIVWQYGFGEPPYPLSLTKLVCTPNDVHRPCYVSIKLIYSDDTYSVWPERILIE